MPNKNEDKPSRLVDLRVTNVSYVTKGANKKVFFLVKDAEQKENEETFVLPVKILKNDIDTGEDEDSKVEKRLVYGVVSEPESIDTYNHVISKEEIEKASHNFMKNYRKIDEMHDFIEGAGQVVESYIAPIDIEMGDQTVKAGSWVLVTKATDEIWEKIQKSEYTGYSLAGLANIIVKKVDNEDVNKVDNQIDVIKSYFEEYVEREENSISNYVYKLMYACWDHIGSENVKENIQKEIDSFIEKINSLDNEKITYSEGGATETPDVNVSVEAVDKTKADEEVSNNDPETNLLPALQEMIKNANSDIMDKIVELESKQIELQNKIEEDDDSDVKVASKTKIKKKKKGLTKKEEKICTLIG